MLLNHLSTRTLLLPGVLAHCDLPAAAAPASPSHAHDLLKPAPTPGGIHRFGRGFFSESTVVLDEQL